MHVCMNVCEGVCVCVARLWPKKIRKRKYTTRRCESNMKYTEHKNIQDMGYISIRSNVYRLGRALCRWAMETDREKVCCQPKNMG